MSTTPFEPNAQDGHTLDLDEQVASTWLSDLTPVEASSSLRARILLGAGEAPAVDVPQRVPTGGWLARNWGFGAMAAAAAMLVVALSVTSRDADLPTSAEAPTRTVVEAPAAVRSVADTPDIYVVQDPQLSLLHAIETFDGVDQSPNDLIAGLSR